MNILRKIPGFRSNKWWKKTVASVFYFFFIITVIAGSSSPSNQTQNIVENKPEVKEESIEQIKIKESVEGKEKVVESSITEKEEPTSTPTSTHILTVIPTSTPTLIVTPIPTKIVATPTTKTTSTTTNGSYACDCSKTCPQMSSCDEAQYQLNVCGCTRRDGDNDGIACDSDCQ